MTSTTQSAALSNAMADAVAAAAAAVVQVQGRGRPVSGLVYAEEVVVTTIGAVGGDDGLRVRRHDGTSLAAGLAGWDPATGLAVLRVAGLGARPIELAETPPRVGNLALAVGRSWSNALTASAGIVAVIGGPLPTGRRRAIDEVIRTTAPMHDGFAGGAFIDTSGRLWGVATAAAIRGLGVVIPASIAWPTAKHVLEHGGVRRAYLGVAGQRARLAPGQVAEGARDHGLLVMGVTPGGPAASAGVLVGDVIVEFDGAPIGSSDDLLDALGAAVIGRTVALRLLRGRAVHELSVTVAERKGDASHVRSDESE